MVNFRNWGGGAVAILGDCGMCVLRIGEDEDGERGGIVVVIAVRNLLWL